MTEEARELREKASTHFAVRCDGCGYVCDDTDVAREAVDTPHVDCAKDGWEVPCPEDGTFRFHEVKP